MQVWALIQDCFREAVDRKLFWVMIGISVLIAAGMACVGFDDKGISILFGTWRIDAPEYVDGNEMGRAVIGGILTKYIADMYIGWIGIIIALIATAGIFPSLMEPGSIDVVLAKPMSRAKIFLGKYAGSMVFVLVQAAVFVTLTFLVVSLRWHYWLWGYFWCIPLIVILFSYVYAFCALFAVLTRSAMTSLLLGMLGWMVIWMPQAVYGLIVVLPSSMTISEETDPEAEPGAFQFDPRWERMALVARWIVPKTQDIPVIAGKMIGAASASAVIFDADDPDLSDRDRRQIEANLKAEQKLENISPIKSIGTSLLFEAIIVMLAMWRFSRQDF